jgi:hypothetical protein
MYCLGLAVGKDPEPDRHHDSDARLSSACEKYYGSELIFSWSDPALRIIPSTRPSKKTIEDKIK